MKKCTAFILVAIILFSLATPTHAASHPESDISPLFLEAQSVSVDLSISSSGFALANVKVRGKDTLRSISIVVCLERYVYGMWVRVDIGKPNNEWTYTCDGDSLNKAFTTNLTISGQYRAVAIVALTGDTVEEVIVTDSTTY